VLTPPAFPTASPPDKRRSRRYRAGLRVDVHMGGVPVPLFSTDVGRHGLFVRTAQPPPERQILRLTIHLPSGNVEVTGCVSRRVLGEDGREPGMGLHFFALSAQAKDQWNAYVGTLAGQPQLGSLPLSGQSPEEPVFFVRLRDTLRLGEFLAECVTTGATTLHTPVLRDCGTPVWLVVLHPETQEEFPLRGVVERVNRDRPKGMVIRLSDMNTPLVRGFETFVQTGRPPPPEASPVPGGLPRSAPPPLPAAALLPEELKEPVNGEVLEEDDLFGWEANTGQFSLPVLGPDGVPVVMGAELDGPVIDITTLPPTPTGAALSGQDTWVDVPLFTLPPKAPLPDPPAPTPGRIGDDAPSSRRTVDPGAAWLTPAANHPVRERASAGRDVIPKDPDGPPPLAAATPEDVASATLETAWPAARDHPRHTLPAGLAAPPPARPTAAPPPPPSGPSAATPPASPTWPRPLPDLTLSLPPLAYAAAAPGTARPTPSPQAGGPPAHAAAFSSMVAPLDVGSFIGPAMATAVDAWQRTTALLERQVEDLRLQRADARAHADSLRAERDEARRELASARAEVAALREQLLRAELGMSPGPRGAPKDAARPSLDASRGGDGQVAGAPPGSPMDGVPTRN
jgi:hypothetical protein